MWISSADTISCCRAPRVLQRSSVEPCLGEEGPWRIWLCRMQRLASAVLRGRPVYGRPVRWRCACRTALRAFNCVYVCAHTQRPHRAVVVFVLAACERCAQRAHCVRALCALALCLSYCSRSIQLCLCVRAHTKATSCRGRVRARSLRALCSEGALCTGALCAGAVPAVLPSERSIVFMCARTHKGHIVPMVVFVLAACERGPRRPQGCVRAHAACEHRPHLPTGHFCAGLAE